MTQRQKDTPPRISDIIEAVSVASKVPVQDILGHRTFPHYTIPRASAYWIARNCTLKSYPQIARAIGNRDHQTIMNGVRRVEKHTQLYRPIIERSLEILRSHGFVSEVKFG